MVHEVILFGKRAVPLENRAKALSSRSRFNTRMKAMKDDLDFRRRWKNVSYIELWSDAAIFKYDDGSKWYMNIS
ncbi:hypothetical protein D7Z26_08300 [Cohnella endophytica]|uniref:Uncharacterized protein n=1 Tax=Cohnella endophytica TaxID=2419778 RepID=A0A494XZM4_9BACL|nr:hypothetical protein [Cohnella endophytica]RKP55208.1 hypothetical protein D7Z26_08300 [Cohnella endophytica]